MVYPKDFEAKVGFHKIRDLLSGYCISSMGRDTVASLAFSDDYGHIRQSLDQVSQFRQLINHHSGFPAQDYLDLRHCLRKLSLDGATISLEDLHHLNISLKTITAVLRFLKSLDPEHYLELVSLTRDKSGWEGHIHHADGLIDSRGQILPHASPLLQEITAKIFKLEKGLSAMVQQSLSSARKAGQAPENSEITVRNGRLVIPVLASQKRKIKGFIHDESSSGQTIYLEPEAAYETNNEIRKLRNAREQEIKRLLTLFTKTIRPDIHHMIHDYQWLGTIDAIRSKALLAIELEASKPQLEDKPLADWQNAIHPLLYLAYKGTNKQVVPLNIRLDSRQRILIISGPNAGGKSVCLKTTGLLQYMLQCGLLIPVNPRSRCGIFHQLFIDIGDEQSLEDDLSTYSSHLRNIKHFIHHTCSRSMFLLDEMGSGTEPQMGGAIAEACLESLYNKGGFGVVTTHYANLKLLPERYEAMENGAMLFDQKKLVPRFILKTGQPGNSFAFEIAENTGLPREVMEEARKKAGTTQLDFEKQLQSLEQEQSELNKKEYELGLADQLLAESVEKYHALCRDMEKDKKQILEQAKEEAKSIIRESNKLIENTIREIKEKQAEKQATQQARKKLEVGSHHIISKNRNNTPAVERDMGEKNKPGNKTTAKGKPLKSKPLINVVGKEKQAPDRPLPGNISKGDTVRIRGQKATGEVLFISGGKAGILAGYLKMEIPAEKLEKVAPSPSSIPKASHTHSAIINSIQERAESFSTVLDLRGIRAEEAEKKLTQFMDDAILTGNYDLRIIHGKGDGILRKVVRKHLDGISQVTRYGDAHVERGGQGVTLVTLK